MSTKVYLGLTFLGGGGHALNYVSPFLKTTKNSISVLQLHEKQVSGPGHSGAYIAVTSALTGKVEAG